MNIRTPSSPALINSVLVNVLPPSNTWEGPTASTDIGVIVNVRIDGKMVNVFWVFYVDCNCQITIATNKVIVPSFTSDFISHFVTTQIQTGIIAIRQTTSTTIKTKNVVIARCFDLRNAARYVVIFSLRCLLLILPLYIISSECQALL
jgi:hypothetical protein